MGIMQSLSQKLDSLGLSFSASTKARSPLGSPNRHLRPFAIAATLLLLLIGFWWVHASLIRSSQKITSQSLQSILSANVLVLRNWLQTQQATSASMAAKDSVQASANALIKKSELNFGWDADDLVGLSDFRTLQKELASEKFLGWSIIDDKDVVIASDIGRLVGQTLPIPDLTRRSVTAGEPTMLMPVESPVSITSDGPLSIAKCPIMGAMAPIAHQNQFVGSLVMLINPLDRFSDLMTVARSGDHIETYVFDHRGVLLTRSPHEDNLRDAGLLSDDPRVVSPLNISIRDPGVDIIQGNWPTTSPKEQRLTVMADHATRRGSGDHVEGYNDYRGVPVAGAWTWLPDYQIAVASEVEIAAAEAPFRSLKRSCYALLSIVALAGLALLFFIGRRNSDTSRFQLDRSIPAAAEGRRFGRYELGEMLGQGGMGSVYRGRHELLRRPVAIKILASPDSGSLSGTEPSSTTRPVMGASMSADSITRFEREVQLTASLRHPNTIDVYDYGRADDGTFFYVMEFIDGITLQQLIDDFGAQPPARVIHLLLQICGSLREAHLSGLIHRDVKPANILLTSEAGVTDWIKVLDFGLIKSVKTEEADQSLTQSDSITGTPMYMSPESVRDAPSSDAPE